MVQQLMDLIVRKLNFNDKQRTRQHHDTQRSEITLRLLALRRQSDLSIASFLFPKIAV